MSTNTPNFNLPIPDDAPEAGQSGVDAILAIRDALLAIDMLLDGQAGAIAGKAAVEHGHAIAAIEGLASALAGKMPADATFSLGDLSDTQGIADALTGYVLARLSNGKWAPISAQAAIGTHEHFITEVQGLTAALAAKADGAAVSSALSDVLAARADRVLGNLTDAYTEVARRLGLMPANTATMQKPTLIN